MYRSHFLLRLSASSVRTFVLGALAAACLATAADASAQSNGALAEKLFLDGQKLMEAGQFPEACAKFADSQRLDPALGTLMHLAACHEKIGKVATAWSEFTDAAAQAQKGNRHEREKYARQHAAALEGKLQRMIIELPRPPEGTTIRLDGSTLPSGVLGTEIPLDPGDHVLEVNAPGKKSWRQDKLNLGPGSVITRVQVSLEDESAATPAEPAIKSAPLNEPKEAGHASIEQPAPASDNRVKRYTGYALGVAGIAAIGVGVGWEVASIGRSNDEGKYPTGTPERQMVADQSSQAQTYAIIFGGVGVAAVGTALYLVLTSPSAATKPSVGDVKVTPLVGRGLAGAGVQIAW